MKVLLAGTIGVVAGCYYTRTQHTEAHLEVPLLGMPQTHAQGRDIILRITLSSKTLLNNPAVQHTKKGTACTVQH